MPSSVIYGMVYRPQSKELDIVFRPDGKAYRYFGVTAGEWEAFRKAPSKGTYLNTVFRDADHAYLKLDDAMNSAGVRPAAQQGTLKPRDVPDTNVWGFYD